MILSRYSLTFVLLIVVSPDYQVEKGKEKAKGKKYNPKPNKKNITTTKTTKNRKNEKLIT